MDLLVNWSEGFDDSSGDEAKCVTQSPCARKPGEFRLSDLPPSVTSSLTENVFGQEWKREVRSSPKRILCSTGQGIVTSCKRGMLSKEFSLMPCSPNKDGTQSLSMSLCSHSNQRTAAVCERESPSSKDIALMHSPREVSCGKDNPSIRSPYSIVS